MKTLHSKVIGEGPILLILHGFLGMSDNWKTLGSRYAEEGFQVHLIDQRNHGQSFHSPEFDYDVMAMDILRYADNKNLETFSLLGHSMGGKTAMRFACAYPGQVNKLIVADIAPKFYPPHHRHIIDALQRLDLSRIGSRSEAEEELSKYLKDFGVRQFLLKNLYWIEKGKLAFRFNLPVLGAKLEEIGERLSVTSQYFGPTLFLRGSNSEYVRINDLPEIKLHFPKAKLETIEGAGHWLHAEQPNAFFEKTLNFLNS